MNTCARGSMNAINRLDAVERASFCIRKCLEMKEPLSTVKDSASRLLERVNELNAELLQKGESK